MEKKGMGSPTCWAQAQRIRKKHGDGRENKDVKPSSMINLF